MSFGPFSDDKGTFMQDVVNVNPRAVIDEISMVRCGYGSNIELFQYQSPDQAKTLPKNSDIGGHHIALYVDDIDKAAAYLKSKNVRTMQGPIPITEGPAAGQSILYFFAPWGLQMELISYPKGMAYAKDAKSLLWSTTEPMK
jgi:catechol 2,3-dioxygenase-like lactoylglutathione lyase family enzyme